MGKNELVEENIYLVPYLYKKFVHKDDLVDRWRDDILQEGYLGLVKAANAYKANSEFKFSTLAHISVKRAMWSFIRTLRNKDHNISLDTEVEDADHGITTIGDLVASNMDLEESIIEKDMLEYDKNIFEKVLLLLPPKRKEIIELYYHGYKTKQIIDLLQVSRSYIADVVKQEIRLLKLYIDIIENDEKAPKLDNFKYKKNWCKAFKSYIKNTLKISLMDTRLNKTVR